MTRIFYVATSKYRIIGSIISDLGQGNDASSKVVVSEQINGLNWPEVYKMDYAVAVPQMLR